jgi:hypothetical protein
MELDAGAFYFCRVWSLAETRRVQTQILDRLATNTWRRLLGDAAGSQIPSIVLRPLLDDLVATEAYLEIRTNSGATPSLVLAARIGDRRAGVWETNLAIAAEILTRGQAKADFPSHQWTLTATNWPYRLALHRVAGWTLLSAGPASAPLAADLAARIRRDGVPFVSAGTNLWLEATLAPACLTDAFPGSAISRLAFSLSGDGANVLTHAKISLRADLPARLEPWDLPPALLPAAPSSFTAVRGVSSLLARWPGWQKVSSDPLPDQFFTWSQSRSAFQLYLAAPSPVAARQVSVVTDWLLQQGNPWLARNGYIGFQRGADGNGVTWGNLADIRPFLRAYTADQRAWLYAGLLPASAPPTGLPTDPWFRNFLSATNALYFDWEDTGARLPPCLQLGQTARLLARRPQMSYESAGLTWLASLVSRLGESVTQVAQTGPAELSLERRSTVGFTAAELHLLADWLEAPDFPCGLHSAP